MLKIGKNNPSVPLGSVTNDNDDKKKKETSSEKPGATTSTTQVSATTPPVTKAPLAAKVDDDDDDVAVFSALQQPIADLFLHCTVLFISIDGFDVWSTQKDPHEVFTLLETIYGAFDKIARKRTVFKVEVSSSMCMRQIFTLI